MESLNERIKQLRKDKGLTQTQLADMLGVTDKAVSKWEVGEANPDISLLAKIAEIFGVSVDYLLTGVAREKEVVIISPKEMLFKTDDIKYLDQISENDLTIVEMYQHKLVNVFTHLVDNKKIRSYLRGKRARPGDAAAYIPEILYLSLIANRLQQLKVFDFDDIGFADKNEWTEEMTEEFVNGDKVNDDTRNYVLTIHCRELQRSAFCSLVNNEKNHIYGNWQVIYPPIFIKFAEAKKWDWVKRMIDIASSINKASGQRYDEYRKNRYYGGPTYILTDQPNLNEDYSRLPILPIPGSVLEALLEDKQYDLLNLANEANAVIGKGTISIKRIDQAKIDADDSLSDDEKFEQKCVYKRIINTKLLSSSDDLKLIRKILDNNYYHYFEMVFDLLIKGNNKELFEFFIDNDYEELAKLLFDSSDDGKGKLLSNAFNCFIVQPPIGLYKDHEDLLKNQNKIQLEETDSERRARERGEKTFRSEFIKQYGNLEKVAAILKDNPIIAHIKELKERVYNGVIERQEAIKAREKEAREREKMAKGLTKEYFEKLLSSGTAESIKLFKLELCSLLDAILIYDYHYEGEDFSERMNAHFRGLESNIPEERQKDDGWGYMVPDTEFTENVIEPERKRVSHLRDIFYRLRVSRNNILHPEKVKVDELTIVELRECLEYVFSINKKVED